MPNRKAINTLLSLLLFIVSGSVLALSPSPYPIKLNAKSYGLEEGLSQIAVSSITEDHNGYVWVGTLNGLNRYNGQKFRHYFAEDGSDLPSSFIRRLFTDSQGRVFVGTDRGLVVYDAKLDRFHAPGKLEDLGGHSISSISETSDGILVSTTNSAFMLDKAYTSVKQIFNSSQLEIKDIKIHKGKKYILTYDGLLINPDINLNPIAENITDIAVLGSSLLAVSKDGSILLDESQRIPIKININYISQSNVPDHIIAVDGNRVIKLNASLETEYLGTLWTNNIDISSIREIDESLYITTYNSGYYATSDKMNLLGNSEVIDSYIWDIEGMSDQTIVMSDNSSRLKVLDTHLNLQGHIDTDIEGHKKLFKLNGNIYISSQSGLYQLDNESHQLQKLLDGRFWSISGFQNFIVLGSEDGSATKLNLSTFETSQYVIDPNGFPIFDLLVNEQQDKHELWVATQGGLYTLEGDTVQTMFNGLVTSLHLLNDHIYFGTNNGLSRINLETDTIQKIYSNNKTVYSITSIADHVLLSSNKEITVFNEATSDTLTLSSVYGSKDEYNLQSVFQLDDTVLFGSIRGFSSLRLDALQEIIDNKTSKPIINIEELKIFNQSENVGGEYLSQALNYLDILNLKYSDYPFTLTFSSPQNQDVSIFYQLEGLSDNYVKAVDINAATYTNLSAGTYKFNVYAEDNLSRVKGDIKSLSINVTPPWWLSPEAKLIYLIIVALITAAIIKAMIRRREVQKKIAQSEERLKLSLWGSGDEMWDWDIESGQIYRSNIWGSLDFPKDGQRAGEPGEESNIHPFDQSRVRDALKSHFDNETEHFEAAYRVKGKSGDWIWILDRAKIVERDEQDRAVRMTGTIKNISNFKQTEEQLKLFERAIRNMSEGMFILDDSFSFVAVNQACCQLSHQSRDKFIGREMNFELYPENYSTQVKQLLLKHGRWHADVEAKRGDGTSFLMELTIDAIYGEADVISHYVGVFSDITRRKSQEEELRKLTNNDGLTGLPNRSNMQVTLSNLVKKDSHHTLMVIDLDNFKKINDSLGHQIGDELLVLVAKRLEQAIPRHTGLYRLGGDEFAILEDKLPDIGSGATIASRIIEHFATPFEIAGEKLVIGLSIGIVLYPEDEQNEQALLRKADIAMYHAKSAGGNRYQFYSESLNKNAIRQLEIENLIRDGLRKDFFQVHYQPKYDIKSNKLTGMEALVRLDHPDKGLISPGEFIPLAEENGLIVEIGDLVLKKACFAAQSWREQGLFNGRVAVNLSSHQFALPDLQQRIESILALTRLPAANLELEITEGTVIKQPEKAIKVMQQLSKMGVSLALDDFGTGYSSLSYLKRFPINTLKIDKAFVDDIDKSDRDLKMVDSIITIAHNMGLSVVGEGVELSAQLSLLKALNCEEIQGFLYSKALPENEFTALLEQQRQNNHSAVS